MSFVIGNNDQRNMIFSVDEVGGNIQSVSNGATYAPLSFNRNGGNVGIGYATSPGITPPAPYSLFTIKSSYSGGTTGGFCIDANDGAAYRLFLYPYVQGSGQVAYQFNVQNQGTTYTSLVLGYNGNVGIGITTPVGELSVLLDGTGANNHNAWTSAYALFGPGVGSTTGSCVGITYNTASNYGSIICLAPTVAWRDMNYVANSHTFRYGNTSLMSIDNGGNVVSTGAITSGGILTATGLTLSSVPDFRILGGGINFYLNNLPIGFWDRPDASTWRMSAATNATILSLNAPTKVSLQVGYTEYLGIAPTFLTTPNTLSISGLASFGQIHINYGGYNVMQRQDGATFYFLIGNGTDAQWNSLRPFAITLSSGLLWSENGQRFTGGTQIDTLTLTNTAQQTSAPRQVLIGSNGTVCQWGQLMSYSFSCGGAGFGWGGNCWMNTTGGQANSIAGVSSNYMVKSTGSSRISLSGTWSAYLGSSLMGINIYFYNASNPGYYFLGAFYQFQNMTSNHACGGAHGVIDGVPAGNYLLFIQPATSINTDYNDYCSFSVIIHP